MAEIGRSIEISEIPEKKIDTLDYRIIQPDS